MASHRAYAFDIHVNSFLPLFFQLYVAQLFLSPVLTRGNWICLFAGNTLYLAALSQYVYVTCKLFFRSFFHLTRLMCYICSQTCKISQ